MNSSPDDAKKRRRTSPRPIYLDLWLSPPLHGLLHQSIFSPARRRLDKRQHCNTPHLRPHEVKGENETKHACEVDHQGWAAFLAFGEMPHIQENITPFDQLSFPCSSSRGRGSSGALAKQRSALFSNFQESKKSLTDACVTAQSVHKRCSMA